MYDSSLYFPKTIRKIFRWFGDIVGYFERRTTKVEADKKALVMAFAMKANFRLRCLLSWHLSIKSP